MVYEPSNVGVGPVVRSVVLLRCTAHPSSIAGDWNLQTSGATSSKRASGSQPLSQEATSSGSGSAGKAVVFAWQPTNMAKTSSLMKLTSSYSTSNRSAAVRTRRRDHDLLRAGEQPFG